MLQYGLVVRRNRSFELFAAAVVAAAVAGCGGGSEQATQAPEGEAGAATVAGKELFSQRCAACHSLEDADASGAVGPNLDELQPEAQQVEAKVRNGGGGMPAFETQLSDEQIRAVAAYVAQATGG